MVESLDREGPRQIGGLLRRKSFHAGAQRPHGLRQKSHREINGARLRSPRLQAFVASQQGWRSPFGRTWLYKRHIPDELQRPFRETCLRQREVSNAVEETGGRFVEGIVRHEQFRPAPGTATLV